MKLLISVLFLFPQTKGGTYISFPDGILDLQRASLMIRDVENFGVLFSLPCSLSAGVLKYRNFGIIFDGRNFVDLQVDKKFLPLYLGAKIGYGQKKILRMAYGAVFKPVEYLSMGLGSMFSYSFELEEYFYNFQSGISAGTESVRGIFEVSWEQVFKNKGMHFGFFAPAPFLDSFRFFSGAVFKNDKIKFSTGCRYSFSIFDFYVSYGEDRLFAGITVNYKKRIEIKEVVKKVEVVKEVPVYIEKKPRVKKKEVVEEKTEKKVLTEEEIEMLELHYKKGIEYYKKDMLEKAIEEWEKIFQINPDYKDVKKYLEETKKKLEKLKEIK